MIDSKTKDEIIDYLIDVFKKTNKLIIVEISKKFNIDKRFVIMFLKQLQDKNFLQYSEMGGGMVCYNPNMELYDFHKNGGFTVHDELIRKNIEKLSLEIKKLESQFPEKTQVLANIINIGNAIFKTINFFK